MNILFICNGNVARSQEAEAFFNSLKKSENDIASSAGIEVDIEKPVHPDVVQVMGELNLDVSKAHRKFVNKAMIAASDQIISFKPKDELPDYVARRRDIIYWTTVDPRCQSIDFHRNVRDEIRSKVRTYIDALHSV